MVVLVLPVVVASRTERPAPRWPGCPSRGTGSRASAAGSKMVVQPHGEARANSEVGHPDEPLEEVVRVARVAPQAGATGAAAVRGVAAERVELAVGDRLAGDARPATARAPAHSSGRSRGSRFAQASEQRRREAAGRGALQLEEDRRSADRRCAPVGAQLLVTAVLDRVVTHDAPVEVGRRAAGSTRASSHRSAAAAAGSRGAPPRRARRARRSSPTTRRPRCRRCGCAPRPPTRRPSRRRRAPRR